MTILRKIILGAVCFLLIIAGAYVYLKSSSPLAAGASASSNDRKVILVTVGNKGFYGGIDIEEVLVNENTSPAQVKMQVSNHSKGFIVSDSFEGLEEKEYTFKALDEVTLPTGTSPQEQMDKLNSGKATEADHIYALTIGDATTIETVTFKYRHLGISHQITISTSAVKLTPTPVPTEIVKA